MDLWTFVSLKVILHIHIREIRSLSPGICNY